MAFRKGRWCGWALVLRPRYQRESPRPDPVYESDRQRDDSLQTGEDTEGELRSLPRRKPS